MAGKGASRAIWDLDRDSHLIRLLQDQVIAGKRSDSGFKKEAWAAVTAAFNKKFTVDYSQSQIEAHYKAV